MFRPPRTVRWKWPLLLAAATVPLAVLVGAATATMDGRLGVLIYPAALGLGAFFGLWARTVRDGFAGGFIAGWAGFFVGTLVGAPIQYALHPDAGWAGLVVTFVAGVVLGAVFGILLGLLAGVGGALSAEAKGRLRAGRVPPPPRT